MWSIVDGESSGSNSVSSKPCSFDLYVWLVLFRDSSWRTVSASRCLFERGNCPVHGASDLGSRRHLGFLLVTRFDMYTSTNKHFLQWTQQPVDTGPRTRSSAWLAWPSVRFCMSVRCGPLFTSRVPDTLTFSSKKSCSSIYGTNTSSLVAVYEEGCVMRVCAWKDLQNDSS